MNINLPASVINPAYAMRTRWAVSKSVGVCLEIGCNLGRMTALLAEKHYVIAGDIDPRLIRSIKKTLYHRQNVDFAILDAHHLPFRDNCVDTVLLIDVLEHLRKPVSSLKEAERVGREKILVNVPNYNFATVLYPNMLPEHFNEPTHQHKTNIGLLKVWIRNVKFRKVNILGSYVPLPLLLIPISYLLEHISKILRITPKRLHFQISCEIILE